MARTNAPVTPADRLSFTLFLALALHAILILGVGFASEPPPVRSNTIDVTIAYHQSKEAPKDADFIAQANQKGSGTLKDKRALTSTHRARFASRAVQRVQTQPRTTPKPQPDSPKTLVVTTSAISPEKREQEHEPHENTPKTQRHSPEKSLEKLSHRIASLQARLDAQKQAYAQRPRIRRITSVSTKASYEARYINAFRRAVERKGTRHFPQRALKQNIFGHVRLMVALATDGSLIEIQILESSGYDFLDRAAVRSVRLAAPFAPFPPKMQKVDRLEIIRTWQFNPEETVTSY